MKPVEIKKGIYWVGAVDWGVRSFHGRTYTTKRGTTYNAYLIVDEKICLVDTVFGPFAQEMISRIREIVDPSRIEYIVVNHVETDHSGALPELMKLCPRARLYGTQKCKEGLYKHYFEDWQFQVVKTGDSLSLGKRSLVFVEAPMLHWPDSMFTYCPQETLLLPNDAFGQHLASSERFDDEVDPCALMEEARTYYANILWPLSALILRKLEEVRKLDLAISMIAPSHGVVWRADPAKIVNAYAAWAQQESANKVVIVYETMWGATEKMARAIAEGLRDAGVAFALYNVAETDRTQVITEMLDARGFLFGSSTHDNDMLPSIAGFLELIKGFKPRKRLAGAFGSYGWGGGAVREIEAAVAAAGIDQALPSIGIRFVPDEKELTACYRFGVDFGTKIKGG